MNFISIEFILFFLALIIVMKLTKGIKTHHIILMIASYVFYAVNNIKFLMLLIGISVLMWYLGKYIGQNIHTLKAKRGLLLGIAVDLFALGIFKYFNFFAGSFNTLFGNGYVPINIMLPVGISFYIFQSISYLADVYTGKLEYESSLVKVLLYIGFFPQIICGPIVKAYDFLPQLKEDHIITWERISGGVQRFTCGLFKKAVLADRLGVAVDAVYSAPEAYSGLSLFVTVISYALQIYYDFSGYSDMAVGIAYMLGFDLGNNFNLPYLAQNPSDFWRRWHISLSSWFRDYVYIPLGGSKKGRARSYLNLFITMLLSGLWHGASWPFVFWGLCHALAAIIYKTASSVKRKSYNKMSWFKSSFLRMISTIFMFFAVAFLWIPFRTNDFDKTLVICKRIFAWSKGIQYVYVYTIIFAVMLILIEGIAVIKNHGNNIWKPLDLSKMWCKVLFCSFFLLIVCFAYVGNSAFIYAQF